ncbi:hypothetical protein Tco_1514888 [Tanacetum coccineum]
MVLRILLLVLTCEPRNRWRDPAILTTAVATTIVDDTSAPIPRAGHGLGVRQARPGIFRDSVSPSVVEADVAGPSQPVEFNVGVARQMCFNAKIRIWLEYELRGRQRFEERCALQGQRAEILKEKNATLEGKVGALESAATSKDAELASSNSQKDKLVDQVSELETTCSGLCDEVIGYKLFKERVQKMQDEQVRVLSDRVSGIDSDLMDMAIHMDENYLTTIAGQRWILSRGLKLVIMKFLQSPRYLDSLGEALGRAIDKGMQDGLKAGVDHGRAGRGLDVITAYDPSAEANFVFVVDALRAVYFPILAQLESRKDASMADIFDLLRLEGHAAEIPEASQLQPLLSSLCFPFIASTSMVPSAAVTISLSTTFVQASTIPPLPSTEVPPSPKIVFEEELNTTLEHTSAP